MSRRASSHGRVRWLALALCATLLAACGGGGGSSDSGNPSGSSGGGSGSGSAAAPSIPPTNGAAQIATIPYEQSTTPNVVNVSVAAATSTARNMLTASVTICAPGTNDCTTIPNVQVDTGSQGLRLLASALPADFALPAVTAGASTAAAGECAVFGSGYTWGAVRRADIRLAGEVAQALPVQIIADPSVPASAPSDCSSRGLPMNDAGSLHVNGILGVGLFANDCGQTCVVRAQPAWYYACASGACTPSAQPLAQQVGNPVAAFATDNNGVLIELPAIGASGATTVSGTLTFGIGTQDDNALGSATVLHTNAQSGFVTTTTSDGTVFSQSYIDSGSNGLFFWSATLPRCGAWFCPTTPQALSATIKGTDGVSVSTTMTIANATALFGTNNWAFDDLAGYNGSMFGWGLPFFYGRRVFTAIEKHATPGGAGPFFAF